MSDELNKENVILLNAINSLVEKQLEKQLGAFKQEVSERFEKLENTIRGLKQSNSSIENTIRGLKQSNSNIENDVFALTSRLNQVDVSRGASRIRYFYNGQSEANSISNPDISDY